MTAYTYATIRSAPAAGYIGLSAGGRHALARIDDLSAPVAAQRRLNAARASGKPAAATDLAAVAAWLDRHLPGVQGVLWEAA